MDARAPRSAATMPRWPPSTARLAAAPRRAPRAPWLLDLARLQQRKRPRRALATLDRLVREYPEEPGGGEALALKARILESAAASADAEAVYLKLAADYPDQDEAASALWRLGWLSWFRGDYAEAAARWGAARLSCAAARRYREAATYWIGARTSSAATARRPRVSSRSCRRRAAELLRHPRRPARRAAPPPGARPRRPLPRRCPPIRASPSQADPRFARVEALRAVGLARFRRRGDGRADPPLARRAQAALRAVVGLRPGVALPPGAAHPAPALPCRARGAASRACRARSGRCSTRSAGEPSSPRRRRAPPSTRCWWRRWCARSRRSTRRRARASARAGSCSSCRTPRGRWRRRGGCRSTTAICSTTPPPISTWAAAYLAGLLREFGDARLAAAAYNAGPTRVREWWGGAPLRRSRGLGRADPVQRDARVRQARDALVGRVPPLYGAAASAELSPAGPTIAEP